MTPTTRLLIACLLLLPLLLQAQGIRTFKDTRIINAHSVETLPKRTLDVRIGHRFGDIFGPSGGWDSFYGLETAADVMIGADYGLTDRINIGMYRSKGTGDLRALVSGMAKVRFVEQSEEGSPLSIAMVGVYSTSTMTRNPNPGFVSSFPDFSHRMAYALQLLLAHKFSDRFSLQVLPSYVHRNLVRSDDVNGVLSVGLAGRVQISKVFGLIIDTAIPLNGPQYPFASLKSADNDYQPILGVGLEIDTGGHVFQLNFTNSPGLIETDYLVNTRSNWLDGGFRMGFTISRMFNL